MLLFCIMCSKNMHCFAPFCYWSATPCCLNRNFIQPLLWLLGFQQQLSRVSSISFATLRARNLFLNLKTSVLRKQNSVSNTPHSFPFFPLFVSGSPEERISQLPMPLQSLFYTQGSTGSAAARSSCLWISLLAGEVVMHHVSDYSPLCLGLGL